MVAKLEWLGDDGPLVVLMDAQAEGWLGIWRDARPDDPPDEIETWKGKPQIMDVELDDDDPATDYARACAALDGEVVATVPFDGGTALALETSGHQAAVIRAGADVVIAKWIFAPDEAHAAKVLSSLPTELGWEDVGVVFEVETHGARLHPAASRTESDVPTLAFELTKGRHRVSTCLYEPDESSSFELFRLERI